MGSTAMHRLSMVEAVWSPLRPSGRRSGAADRSTPPAAAWMSTVQFLSTARVLVARWWALRHCISSAPASTLLKSLGIAIGLGLVDDDRLGEAAPRAELSHAPIDPTQVESDHFGYATDTSTPPTDGAGRAHLLFVDVDVVHTGGFARDLKLAGALLRVSTSVNVTVTSPPLSWATFAVMMGLPANGIRIPLQEHRSTARSLCHGSVARPPRGRCHDGNLPCRRSGLLSRLRHARSEVPAARLPSARRSAHRYRTSTCRRDTSAAGVERDVELPSEGCITESGILASVNELCASGR